MGEKTIWFVFLLLLTALILFCLVQTPHRIEADLRIRSTEALREHKVLGIALTVRGQNVFLSGTVTSAARMEEAIRAVEALRGVQKVVPKIQIKAAAVHRDSLQAFRKWLTGAILFFGPKGWQLSESGKKTLRFLADSLKNHASVKLAVLGYCDSTGSASLNQRLSRKRAELARRFLIARGIAAARLSARGPGSANPRASNATEAGRAQNRRVEFRLMENR